MPRNLYDLKRLEAEAERQATEAREAQQKAEAAKRKAEAEAAFKAESVKKVNDYITYRAENMLETGHVSPKVLKAYLSLFDLTKWEGESVYIKAVRKLLSNALYGVTKVANGYRFNETEYPTVKALQEAILGQLGRVEIAAPDNRWFEVALSRSLQGMDTKDESMIEYVVALEPMKEAPEDVTTEDYERLELLGLAYGLINPDPQYV